MVVQRRLTISASHCLTTAICPAPRLTLAFFSEQRDRTPLAVRYGLIQIASGSPGVWLSHAKFDVQILQSSTPMHRTGRAHWFAELVATFGLLFFFEGLRRRPDTVPTLVALYITGPIGSRHRPVLLIRQSRLHAVFRHVCRYLPDLYPYVYIGTNCRSGIGACGLASALR